MQHFKGGGGSRRVGVQQDEQAVGEYHRKHLHHVFRNLYTVGHLDQQFLQAEGGWWVCVVAVECKEMAAKQFVHTVSTLLTSTVLP